MFGYRKLSTKKRNRLITRPNMRFILYVLIFVLIYSTSSAIDWQQSLDDAFRLSRERDKLVFAFFSGKQCPECDKMREEVFGQKEFQDWAEKNFITVEITDAASVDEVLKRNRYALWEKHKIKHLPSIILFTKEKKVLICVFYEDLVGLKKKLTPYIYMKND